MAFRAIREQEVLAVSRLRPGQAWRKTIAIGNFLRGNDIEQATCLLFPGMSREREEYAGEIWGARNWTAAQILQADRPKKPRHLGDGRGNFMG